MHKFIFISVYFWWRISLWLGCTTFTFGRGLGTWVRACSCFAVRSSACGPRSATSEKNPIHSSKPMTGQRLKIEDTDTVSCNAGVVLIFRPAFRVLIWVHTVLTIRGVSHSGVVPLTRYEILIFRNSIRCNSLKIRLWSCFVQFKRELLLVRWWKKTVVRQRLPIVTCDAHGSTFRLKKKPKNISAHNW